MTESTKDLAENKRATFDYEILEKYEAGLDLQGGEVKSIRAGRVNIAGSYAVVRNNEIWLINADIPPYQVKNATKDYDSKRSRKLLLHAEEIRTLAHRLEQKTFSLLPLRIYDKKGHLKLEIALGKSRKAKDKREVIKKREIDREIRRIK